MKTSGNFNTNVRQAGILMPVFSLPANHGIGDLGKSAYDFVDLVASAKFKIWQILPLNPAGYGESPYQPSSSFAGDEVYINLDFLVEEGLLKEAPAFEKDSEFIDYSAVRAYKSDLLHQAFKKFIADQDYQDFVDQAFWLDGYAKFIARKKANDNKSWLEWTTLEYDEEEYKYQFFVQYCFAKQWLKLKEYANSKGIIIMGDMPIYVGLDSADVYDNQECFLLDQTGHPTSVAGVPPDYFSEDGQLWGNPLYDWDYLKAHDYSFWMKRLSWNKGLFDIIRIDHFRAFDTYWKVPAGETTARNGEWILGPAYDFFDYVYDKMPDLNLVAEDLGDLRPEVLELKDHYHMLGMRIAQFSFGDDMAKVDYKLPEFCIAYTGTHDNAPVNGWYSDLTVGEKKHAKAVMNHLQIHGKTMADRQVKWMLSSDAVLAIIMMEDFLALGNVGRINTPSTIGAPNWCWKMSTLAPFARRIKHIKHLLKTYHRA